MPSRRAAMAWPSGGCQKSAAAASARSAGSRGRLHQVRRAPRDPAEQADQARPCVEHGVPGQAGGHARERPVQRGERGVRIPSRGEGRHDLGHAPLGQAPRLAGAERGVARREPAAQRPGGALGLREAERRERFVRVAPRRFRVVALGQLQRSERGPRRTHGPVVSFARACPGRTG